MALHPSLLLTDELTRDVAPATTTVADRQETVEPATRRSPAVERVDWVDYAKGLCIVFVVMMHSTGNVQFHLGSGGWLEPVVAFAKPFRMPDFFLISGLFLARTLGRRWRDYLDTKVVHFVYFYLIWAVIHEAVKAPATVAAGGWSAPLENLALALVQPSGTLWFIYMLPVFCVVTRLVRRVPWPVVWLAAAALQVVWATPGLEGVPIPTGARVLDSFAERFVYFYSGYLFAPQVFRLAAWAGEHVRASLALLVGWGLVNGGLVFAGWADAPGVGLVLGFLGAGAVVATAALLARTDLAAPLRYCGRHSIVIYLSFFLFVAATRTVMVKSGLISDAGTIAAAVTAAAVVGPLVAYWVVRRTPLRLLFERPSWARLTPRTRSDRVMPT